MSYAILGAGKVGQALATAFARKGVEVAIASRRPVEALAANAALCSFQVTTKMLATRLRN